MTDYTDYDIDDVIDAAKTELGINIIYTCIDDEHLFWFIMDDAFESLSYEDCAYAECLDELLSNDDMKIIEQYLANNCETN